MLKHGHPLLCTFTGAADVNIQCSAGLCGLVAQALLAKWQKEAVTCWRRWLWAADPHSGGGDHQGGDRFRVLECLERGMQVSVRQFPLLPQQQLLQASSFQACPVLVASFQWGFCKPLLFISPCPPQDICGQFPLEIKLTVAIADLLLCARSVQCSKWNLPCPTDVSFWMFRI